MRKLVALVFFSSIFVIALSAQAQIRTDTLGGPPKTIETQLVGEKVLASEKVYRAVKQAMKEGKVLVVYTDHGLHEDIVSLGIEPVEGGKERVVYTGQYGIHPSTYNPEGSGSPRDRESWVQEANRVGKNPKIDGVVIVSPEKLEQLNKYTKICQAEPDKKNYGIVMPFIVPGSSSNCWTYAETTWNDWQKMAEPELPSSISKICKEVNESYSGACTGLKFVCSSIYCQASKPTYANCLKKNHDAINSCMHNNTYCIDSHIKSKEDCVSNMIEPVHERFKKKDAVPAATPEIAKTPEPPRPKGSSRSAADVAAACKEFNSFWTGGAEGRAKIEAGAPPEQAAFFQSVMGMSEKLCDCLADQLVNKQQGTAEEIDQIINMWNTKSWDVKGATMMMSGGVGRASSACSGAMKADMQKIQDDARRMIDSMPK